MLTDQTIFRFDDVTVECEDFRVRKGGRKIDLTPRAFDVLHFLLTNSGRVVEKQEIFDHVWKDTFVSDNALTKIIKEIRHELDDDANDPRCIETVPKRGYRFIADLSEPPTPLVPEDGWPKAGGVGAAGGLNESQESGVENLELKNGTKRPDAKDQNKKIPLVLFAGIIAVVLGTAAFYYFSRGDVSNKQTSNSQIDSIAVLPFENVSQDPNAEYLSDGITESLINRLSLLSNLKVMSRSSVVQYKGKEQEAKKVGNELNVRAVLTGSVKQIGDQIVITVRFDDAQNDRHIWGEQYIRKFADILNIQNEIAQEVSSNLRVKLTSADQQQLAKRYTDNIEAYQLYLKGRYELNKFTQEDLQKSIEYYNQAIEKDPNYALAYAGLAVSYISLGNTYLPPNEVYPKARSNAAKALEIDETLADAHEVMGAIRLFYDWDWAEAEKELKGAQTLNPNLAGVHHLNADYYEAMGRLDDARSEIKRAQELEPLSLMINSDVGVGYYYLRQYDEAIAQNENTTKLDPHFFVAYLWLGQAYEQKKMYSNAIKTFQKGIVEAERNPQLIASLGHAYALASDRDKAIKTLNELREISKQRYISPYLFAVVYVGLGDKEQAFAWLEKAFQQRTFFLIWLSAEPRFDPLRGDPRFGDLLHRIGLQPLYRDTAQSN